MKRAGRLWALAAYGRPNTLAGYEAKAMVRKGQAHKVGGRDVLAQTAFVAGLFGGAA